MTFDQFYNVSFAAGLDKLAAGSVPLVVTDPPYGIAYHSNHHSGRNPHAPVAGDWDFQIGPFFSALGRVLKDGGAAYVFSRWDVYPLWFHEVAGSGLKLANVIVWVKDNHSAGDLKGNFGNKYEVLLFLTKGRHERRGKRLTNVWECPRVPHTRALHPTEKPVELYKMAIEFSSQPGDLVVDPCCGSGPVGAAAQATGRHFLGFDVDAKMVAVAQRRLGLPVTVCEPVAPAAPAGPVSDPTLVVDPSVYALHPEDIRAAAELWRSTCPPAAGA